jgi:DNA-3-methyladenine glycosylase
VTGEPVLRQRVVEPATGRLLRPFFERYTPTVARDLLGRVLVRVVEGRRLSGVIVETEAYRGARDPASHAYRGRTARNEVMYGEAGYTYVYFAYGFHHMLNLTTEAAGTPGAVLIRAIEPLEGASIMMANRGVGSLETAANGPGNLTKALRIDRSLNGEDTVTSRRLFIENGAKTAKVAVSSRVGIAVGASYKWRFYVEGSRFLSKGRPSAGEAQNP